jgi:hypothetical protein
MSRKGAQSSPKDCGFSALNIHLGEIDRVVGVENIVKLSCVDLDRFDLSLPVRLSGVANQAPDLLGVAQSADPGVVFDDEESASPGAADSAC